MKKFINGTHKRLEDLNSDLKPKLIIEWIGLDSLFDKYFHLLDSDKDEFKKYFVKWEEKEIFER